jgi:micrococcal nuclease
MSTQGNGNERMAELERAAQAVKGRKRQTFGLRLFLLLLLMAAAAYGYFKYGLVVPEGRVEVTLVKVLDGDTLVVEDPHDKAIKVRLVGIDAPEIGSAASFRSALFTAEQLENARLIKIEAEPDKPRDQYGRSLAWVWYTAGDGRERLLQEELVRNGLADVYRYAKDSTYYEQLVKAQKKTKKR